MSSKNWIFTEPSSIKNSYHNFDNEFNFDYILQVTNNYLLTPNVLSCHFADRLMQKFFFLLHHKSPHLEIYVIIGNQEYHLSIIVLYTMCGGSWRVSIVAKVEVYFHMVFFAWELRSSKNFCTKSADNVGTFLIQ